MLKPLDIHNAEFKRSFKGYNESEVDSFLAKVVGEYETLFKENKRLSEENEALKAKLQKDSHKEQDIYDLISLAKQTVAEARDVATRQAQAVVEEAEQQAKRIIADAKGQAEQEEKRIGDLVKTEKMFKDRMRKVMETIWAMLEEPGTTSKQMDETRVYREIAPTTEEQG